MGPYTVRRIDEMESIFHGAVRRAAAELGVESFGMQVIDMPPQFADYPEHDHSDDGQEEVYVVLRGSAEFVIDGEVVQMDPGRIVRIEPAARRRVRPGPEGVRVLAIGGAPRRPYKRPADFELGAPTSDGAHEEGR